jgi:hypothetical protein
MGACIALVFSQWSYRASGQTISDLPRVFRELQSEKTTKNALHEIWFIYSVDSPGTRDFLAQHLPRLIAEDPGFSGRDRAAECILGEARQAWLNDVDVAATFKIVEAVPALSKWIQCGSSAVTTLSSETLLVFYPAARALIEIGDPAVPAIQPLLKSANPRIRYNAAHALLCMDEWDNSIKDRSPRADAALRDFIAHGTDRALAEEVDTDLKMIAKSKAENPAAFSH